MICVAVPDDVMQIVHNIVTGLIEPVTLNMTNQEKKKNKQKEKTNKGKPVHWQLERSQSPV